MLSVTAINILTGPDMLMALLEYIDIIQPESQWQYKADINFWRICLSLALHNIVFKPS